MLLPDGSVTTLSPALREEIVATVVEMSALRCLGFALKTGAELGKLGGYDGGESHPAHKDLMDPGKYESIENDLTFCGLAGLQDPRGPSSRRDRRVQDRGHPRRGHHGGQQAHRRGYLRGYRHLRLGGPTPSARSFTGREFSDMPLAKKKILASPGGCVFSRALEPKHKQDIVRLLKEADEIVAMTGA